VQLYPSSWNINLFEQLTRGKDEQNLLDPVVDLSTNTLYSGLFLCSVLSRSDLNSGKITGAVLQHTYNSASSLHIDNIANRLVVVGSADQSTSSGSVWFVDLKDFKVVSNETIVAVRDFDASASVISVSRRSLWMGVVFFHQIYKINLDNFAQYESIATIPFSGEEEIDWLFYSEQKNVLYVFAGNGNATVVDATSGNILSNFHILPSWTSTIGNLIYDDGSSLFAVSFVGDKGIVYFGTFTVNEDYQVVNKINIQ